MIHHIINFVYKKIDFINNFVYNSLSKQGKYDMKLSEFARWLRAQGVTFKEGKKHTKLYFGTRQSVLPRHAAEIGEGLRKTIIKQLGLKED
ncbi:MAG: hypothetical protein ABL925_10510 [Methylococcales bacterium]